MVNVPLPPIPWAGMEGVIVLQWQTLDLSGEPPPGYRSRRLPDRRRRSIAPGCGQAAKNFLVTENELELALMLTVFGVYQTP